MMDFSAIAAGLNLIAGSGCLLVAILVWIRRRGIPHGYGPLAIVLGLIFFAGGVERCLLWYERAVGDIINPEITQAFVVAVIARGVFAVTAWYIVYWIMRHDIHIIGGDDKESVELSAQLTEVGRHVKIVDEKLGEVKEAVETDDKKLGELTQDIHNAVVEPIVEELEEKAEEIKDTVEEQTEEVKEEVEEVKEVLEDDAD
jgi:hypothetical protein